MPRASSVGSLHSPRTSLIGVSSSQRSGESPWFGLLGTFPVFPSLPYISYFPFFSSQFPSRYQEEQELILRQLEEPLPEASSVAVAPALNNSQSLGKESSQPQSLGGPQSSARARKKRVQQQL